MIDTAGASADSEPLAADDKVTVAAKSLMGCGPLPCTGGGT